MSDSDITVPPSGDVIRPELTLVHAYDLVKRLYGMTVTSAIDLVSYVDRNFHVYVEDRYDNLHVKSICRHGYVLKILNSDDSKRPDQVEAQNLMILHLLKSRLRVPEPVKTVNGELMMLQLLPPGIRGPQQNGLKQEGHSKLYMVRMFEYIPGEMIHKFPFSPALMYRIGAMTGEVDHYLKTFSHPAYETYKGSWCLTEIKNVRQCIGCITDHAQRTVVLEVVSAVERNVLDKYDSFSRGTIHGDVNEYNILLCHVDNQTDEKPEIALLDFGDTVNSCHVFEISVLICYVIIRSKPEMRLENAGHALAGYLSRFPLSSCDLNVLKECISGRLAQSFVISKYSAIKDPQNADYLLSRQVQTWDSLRKLWKMPKEEFNAALKCYVDQYVGD